MIAPADQADEPFNIRTVRFLTVISARRVDFVGVAVNRLLRFSRTDTKDKRLPHNSSEVKERLAETVAELDWRLFVTPQERKERMLNLSTRLENLDREAIWKAVEKRLGKKLSVVQQGAIPQRWTIR